MRTFAIVLFAHAIDKKNDFARLHIGAYKRILLDKHAHVCLQ